MCQELGTGSDASTISSPALLPVLGNGPIDIGSRRANPATLGGDAGGSPCGVLLQSPSCVGGLDVPVGALAGDFPLNARFQAVGHVGVLTYQIQTRRSSLQLDDGCEVLLAKSVPDQALHDLMNC